MSVHCTCMSVPTHVCLYIVHVCLFLLMNVCTLYMYVCSYTRMSLHCTCMYVCSYSCMSVHCTYMSVPTHECLHMYMYVCSYTRMSVHCTCMSVPTHVCLYIVHVCLFLLMYVCTLYMYVCSYSCMSVYRSASVSLFSLTYCSNAVIVFSRFSADPATKQENNLSFHWGWLLTSVDMFGVMVAVNITHLNPNPCLTKKYIVENRSKQFAYWKKPANRSHDSV